MAFRLAVAAICRRRNNTHSARLERRLTNDDGSKKQATSDGVKQPRTAFVSADIARPLITIQRSAGRIKKDLSTSVISIVDPYQRSIVQEIFTDGRAGLSSARRLAALLF